MKICPVGAELFDEDGQTDRQTDRQTQRTDIMQLIVAFRNFANMSKRSQSQRNNVY